MRQHGPTVLVMSVIVGVGVVALAVYIFARGGPGVRVAPGGAPRPPGESVPFPDRVQQPREPSEAELVALGRQLSAQLGCVACHSIDGTRLVGPTWKGLYGSEVRLDDGSTVVADEAYLRESILEPDAKVVAGFPAGTMASAVEPFRQQLAQARTVDALVAYIKSLK